MSSNVYIVDFHINNRILKQMMRKAGYVTARMRPLTGPLFHQSKLVLNNFMTGVMIDQRVDTTPLPEGNSAYGQA